MEPEEQAKLNIDRRSLSDELKATLADESAAGSNGRTSGEVAIAEARRGPTLRNVTSERTNIRIAFITNDTAVLTPGSSAQQHYADLAQFVGEIHLLVLKPGRGEGTVERPMPNVWLYHLPGRYSWQRVYLAWETARRHLRFNGVVQPDVVVATDPFAAGLAAWVVSWRLRRQWQVHIKENVFSLEWISQAKERKRLFRLARFVVARARSVRTATARIKQYAAPLAHRDADVAVLPHRFNLSAYRATPALDLHQQYSQYILLVMADGVFSAESPLHEVFAGVHKLLHNPRVGLLVRGSGKAKSLFTEKVKLLGIERQVVFLPGDQDPVPMYQSADIFVETGLDSDADERVLRAIAAGTSVVCYRNDFRAGIITDGEAGFLVEPSDSFTLGQHVRRLINDSPLRTKFSLQANAIAEEQLHEDVHSYFQAFRDSIAGAIVASPAPVAEETELAAQPAAVPEAPPLQRTDATVPPPPATS